MAPEGADTRPTGDRVREATFNALTSLDALDGAEVVDLFAGSGALGIEALSRGAAHCTFVERSRPALEAIAANLAATGLAASATVVADDASAFARSARRSYDLVLADPPYAFDGWAELLSSLPAPMVVVESDREVALPEGWSVLRSRRYGGTVVIFGRRADQTVAE